MGQTPIFYNGVQVGTEDSSGNITSTLMPSDLSNILSGGTPSPGSVPVPESVIQSTIDWLESIPVPTATPAQAQAAAAAAGFPTSWLTTPIPSLGGMPGWAVLAFGALAFVMVIGMTGGRR
jgi:hypothetical protein